MNDLSVLIAILILVVLATILSIAWTRGRYVIYSNNEEHEMKIYYKDKAKYGVMSRKERYKNHNFKYEHIYLVTFSFLEKQRIFEYVRTKKYE